MAKFQVPVWFNLEADSKDDAIEMVDAQIAHGEVEYSIESENVLEFDENGDEVIDV